MTDPYATYPCPLWKTKTRADQTQFGLRLPEDIRDFFPQYDVLEPEYGEEAEETEKSDAASADEDIDALTENVAAQVCLKTDVYDDRTITYLDVQLVEVSDQETIGEGAWVGKRKEYKIRNKDGYLLLKVAIQHLRDYEEAPFYKMDNGDRVMVELPPSQDGFFVYRWEDYHYRQRDVDPVLHAPLFVSGQRQPGDSDVAWNGGNDGQRVRFIPFDRHQFQTALKTYLDAHADVEVDLSDADADLEIGNDLFQQVKRDEELQQPEVDRIDLYGFSMVADFDAGLPANDDPPWQQLAETQGQQELVAKVPPGAYKARFHWTNEVDGRGETAVTRDVVVLHRDVADRLGDLEEIEIGMVPFGEWATEDWWAPFFNVDNDEIIVFCPVSV